MTPAERIKSVAPVARDLLPTTATPFEQALLAVELASLAETNAAIIATIWDPMQCPAVLLPWLAWALSVDVWDETWPEAVKREVIAASPMVHRLKGTIGSVVRALEAMGMNPKITEWWETSPIGRRGTFSITVYVNQQNYAGQTEILTEKNQLDALNTVRAVKPKSRVFSFELGAGYKNTIGVANAFAATEIAHGDLMAKRNTNFDQRIGVGNSLASMTIDRRTVEVGRDNQLKSGLGVASAISAMQVMRATFAA